MISFPSLKKLTPEYFVQQIQEVKDNMKIHLTFFFPGKWREWFC